MMMMMIAFQDERKQKRPDIRRNGMWHEHIEKLEHLGEAEFISRYTMTKNSFDKLVDLLDISVDELQSKRSTSGVTPITKELVVAVGLRALSGSHTKDLVDIFHISRTSVKRVARKFREAVLECDELSMDLPKNQLCEKHFKIKHGHVAKQVVPQDTATIIPVKHTFVVSTCTHEIFTSVEMKTGPRRFGRPV